MRSFVTIVVLVLLLQVDSAGAFPIERWNKAFGGRLGDTAETVQQTSDGGYILAGFTHSYDSGLDARLIKTDVNGNEIWNKTFGGNSDDGAFSSQQISDGGYMLAGFTKSYGSGVEDAWLIKTDVNGNEIWNKTFGGKYDDGTLSAQQTSDGGYILAGFTEDDSWLIKTDTNGNEIWNKTFKASSRRSKAETVQQTSDGGYILGINTFLYAWLIKTKANGEMQWQLFNQIGKVNSVQQTLDDGYIFSGTIGRDYGRDIWLLKTHPNGTLQWETTLGYIGDDGATYVRQTLDGGYIMVGYTFSEYYRGYNVWLKKFEDINEGFFTSIWKYLINPRIIFGLNFIKFNIYSFIFMIFLALLETGFDRSDNKTPIDSYMLGDFHIFTYRTGFILKEALSYNIKFFLKIWLFIFVISLFILLNEIYHLF